MIDNKFERVAPDSPDRCKAIVRSGQCPYKRTKDSQFCFMHCGPHNEANEEKKKIRNYRAGIWQARINEFADNDNMKSLREEVGILRSSLESLLIRCSDDGTLYANSHKIRGIVNDIEKVVSSCHRLEQATGQLLDKNMAINFVGRIVEIVSTHVKDSDQLHKIGNEILIALGQITRKEEQ